MPDQNVEHIPAPPNFIGYFYESNTEGTNFGIMLICFMFVKCACFVLYSVCVRFDLVKSPEVTLYGWLGYTPSMNK